MCDKLILRIYKKKFFDLLLYWCLLLFNFYLLGKWRVIIRFDVICFLLFMLLFSRASVFLLINILLILDYSYIYVTLKIVFLRLVAWLEVCSICILLYGYLLLFFKTHWMLDVLLNMPSCMPIILIGQFFNLWIFA